MKIITPLSVALSLSLATFGAAAVGPIGAPLEDALVSQHGYIEVSEGFFTKVSGGEERFVARGEEGNRALRAKLIELRDAYASRDGKGRSNGESIVDKYDQWIDELDAPVEKSVWLHGDCGGQHGATTFEVDALAAYGTIATGYVTNSDPSINTTNSAAAYTIRRDGEVMSQQMTVTYGGNTARAVATFNGPRACDAIAYATIKCPGLQNPSITGFAHAVAFTGCQR